ncbi:hypothetical protein BDN72DRAFT_953908 [Pluteus cervinus]|uniref:Uncharacterized protein n=1 Tax=Pluteus cervinus TaxID=181527 RepID=A0ACD3BID6_9AGAR|nr:hypothetical protein BDN72DRAFT_953908 [Pluteus cervinus]
MAADRFSLAMPSLLLSEASSISAFMLPFVVKIAGFLYAAFGFTLSVLVIATQSLLSYILTIDSPDTLVKSLEDLRRQREQTLSESAAVRPIINLVNVEHAAQFPQSPASVCPEPEVTSRDAPNRPDDHRQGFKMLTLKLRPKLSRSRSSPALAVPKVVLHLPSPPPSPPAPMTDNEITTNVDTKRGLKRIPTAPGSLHDMASKGNNFFSLKKNVLAASPTTALFLSLPTTRKKKTRSQSSPTQDRFPRPVGRGLLTPPS